MDPLLDFSKDLDIHHLDSLVNTLYTSHGEAQKHAQAIISSFQDHPEAWTRVDTILSLSSSLQTKYIALQILERLIQSKWKILPRDQCIGIRDYIVSLIIKHCEEKGVYLNKLNLILVQILKHEWPKYWSNFIPEIIQSSRTSLALCENNMIILKLLSEEIFDSSEQMTMIKQKNLKQSLCGEFSKIYELCVEVLERGINSESLILATLQTLLRFLNWIPLGYIFETDLVQRLVTRYLSVMRYRNVTLKCLIEIAGLQVSSREYEMRLVELFSETVKTVAVAVDYRSVYDDASDYDQEYIQSIALFLVSFLSEHLQLVEQQLGELTLHAHSILLSISRVDDREIFKITLEYYQKLVSQLYSDSLSNSTLRSSTSSSSFYSSILSQLRVLTIESMVKPEEVLIVENDEGEIVREFIKETDTIILYKSMRELLVYLTHLNVQDTEQIISDKLSKQMDGSEWSWQNLNRLCWAIGSISGAMDEDTEKRFLVFVIKDLLSLTEMKRGKDNKAVVASNIMYVVGQYPRFLRAHWKFLKTVVNKLFEFMHETHEGVQDMACDTFIKIAQKCRRHFVTIQQGESCAFIDEILQALPSIISDLSSNQINVFYEAVGYMIQAQTRDQDRLIMALMDGPNQAFDLKIRNIQAVLADTQEIKQLSAIIKTASSACGSIGSAFIVEIAHLFNDLMNLYRVLNTAATAATTTVVDARSRAMRALKRDILKLEQLYIQKSEEIQVVKDQLVPPLLETILPDYSMSLESEVLVVLDAIVVRLGPLVQDKVIYILDAVFKPTLALISKDFQEYPEHRVAFYNLLRSINMNCFNSLLSLPPDSFKLFLDAVVWAFKHTMRDIADTGLLIVLELLQNVSKLDRNTAMAFYERYYVQIFQDVFYVLTDREHKAGFKYQAMILYNMIQVEYDIRAYFERLLMSAFSNLSSAQVRLFVEGMFGIKDMARFKSHLRDFLVEMKEFGGDDNQDLFLEEREREIEEGKRREMEERIKVPGMLKPSEIQMDD